MQPNVYLYLHWAISVVVIAFLSYLLLSHLFGKLKRNIRLEGFESTIDLSGNSMVDVSNSQPTLMTDLSGSQITVMTGSDDKTVVAEKPVMTGSDDKSVMTGSIDKPVVPDKTVVADKPVVITASSSTSDTDKSTIMAELFENVNKQLDIVRTFKLSDTLVPIKIDKTPQDDVLILANLKLLVNNGVSKNELDLKEVYDKYIGNKAVLVLVSDLNSLNLVRVPDNLADLETTFLSRTKAIVDAHQKIIDKILDNKSKQ